jgi:hypothetical protein
LNDRPLPPVQTHNFGECCRMATAAVLAIVLRGRARALSRACVGVI